MSVLQNQDSVLTEKPAYKNILVGYDGSKNSDRALARAATLAKEHGASLRIVVVANTSTFASAPMVPPIPEEAFEDLIKNAKDMLADAIKEASSIAPKATGSVEEGYPAECILDLAASEGVDLIVLGRRGISGVERFFLGGVSSNVVAHSKCDVLVVK
jgi:nucleotide-binding universal stress UspA family protein